MQKGFRSKAGEKGGVEGFSGSSVVIPKYDEEKQEESQGSQEEEFTEPKVKVPVDLDVENNEQKNADSGHSPWKLDPLFVSQVFVSLKMSEGGIQGDYPVDYNELTMVKNDGVRAVVEVNQGE